MADSTQNTLNQWLSPISQSDEKNYRVTPYWLGIGNVCQVQYHNTYSKRESEVNDRFSG